MKKVISLFSLLICLAMLLSIIPTGFSAKAAEADYTSQQWKSVDISLTSTVTYANPFKDVQVNAVFTHEDGTTIAIPGFWNGGSEWKVRFSPTKLGNWTFSISSSDNTNTGLVKTGTLIGTANTGSTEVDKKGFVRLETNKRYFVYDDGTPFYWLGDTHWQMFDNEHLTDNDYPGSSNPSEFKMLLQNRVDKGFTVYQTYPDSSQGDGGGNTRRYNWWTKKGVINPKAFNDNYDVMMSLLADSGMTVAMGIGVHTITTTGLSEEDLLAYTRYIVARYACYNVLWITGQEIDSDMAKDGKSYTIWKKVGALIDALDGYKHPQGAHIIPANYSDVSDLDAQPWHEWWTLQGGHGGLSGVNNQSRYKSFFTSPTKKPYVETEANYEDIYCGGFTGYDAARVCAWKANQCGTYGYTYGAEGIWAMRYDTSNKGWPTYNSEPWYAGMDKPGSFEMMYMKNFYEAVGFYNLIPRFDDPDYCTFTDNERSVLSSDGNTTYVAYFYSTTNKTGKLKGMDTSKTYTSRWYNTKTGKYVIISTGFMPAADGTYTIPDKPNTSDWVLLVTCKDFGDIATEAAPTNYAPSKPEAEPTGSKLVVKSYTNVISTKGKDISQAFDGNPATYWQAFAVRVSNTIIMDLGETKTIGFMRLVYPKLGSIPTQAYRIDVSDNGTDWTIAVDRTTPSINAKIPSGKEFPVVNEQFLAQGRYVKLIDIGTADDAIPLIGEIELYEGDASLIPAATPVPEGIVTEQSNQTTAASSLPMPIVVAGLLALGFLSFGASFALTRKKFL